MINRIDKKQSPLNSSVLTSAIEQTADNVFITDKDGIIQYVNPAFENLTGYTRAEAIGKTPRLLRSGEHSQEFYENMWKTILSGKTYRGDFINRKKNGDLYFEEKTITPIRDGQGNLSHFVSTGKDITERVLAFQDLERQVDDRTRETADLFLQSQQNSRELDALYRADMYLHRHLQLDQVLQSLVDVVIDILFADKASVQVWDAKQERLVVRAARGYSQEMLSLMSTYVPGDGIAGNVFLTGEPIAVEDARKAPPPANLIAEREGIRSVLSVPITIGDQIFGVFGMDYSQPRTFSAADKRLFLALAQRAALAIENARLYEQAGQTAILVERQRLSRELHDSVTQSLYSLMLLAEAGRRLAAAGEARSAQQHLARIGETAQQALKEMRLLVYEMRSLALQEVGLAEALQQRLDAVEKRAGIQARLLVEGTIDLPAPVEEDLYRIAQEALNNSLKHAGSTATTVTIRSSASQVELEIADNGRGLDPDSPAKPGRHGNSQHARTSATPAKPPEN
jgi:PAS domain S-box-containing protein